MGERKRFREKEIGGEREKERERKNLIDNF